MVRPADLIPNKRFSFGLTNKVGNPTLPPIKHPEIIRKTIAVLLTTIIDNSEPDHRRFIFALFNLSVKTNEAKISRRVMEERLKESRSRFNALFHYWLKLGLIEADKFDIWLTPKGTEAVEHYRLRKDA